MNKKEIDIQECQDTDLYIDGKLIPGYKPLKIQIDTIEEEVSISKTPGVNYPF